MIFLMHKQMMVAIDVQIRIKQLTCILDCQHVSTDCYMPTRNFRGSFRCQLSRPVIRISQKDISTLMR